MRESLQELIDRYYLETGSEPAVIRMSEVMADELVLEETNARRFRHDGRVLSFEGIRIIPDDRCIPGTITLMDSHTDL